MINITLLDGSQREYSKSLTGIDIASSISSGLLKEALAIKINSNIHDLREEIHQDCKNGSGFLDKMLWESSHALKNVVRIMPNRDSA